jgi:hypothetical protein
MSNPEPVKISVSPEPTDAELAAIIATYREVWPAPVEQVTVSVSKRWRFSGRWWSETPARRGYR